jgi:hypothetical protein
MFNLSSRALVLEVGSGSNPWQRSDVLLDRYYVDETGQRGGGEIFRDRRPMIVAAGERLPFKDKAFDFVYTCHVIEHAEDIVSMLREMSRVGKAGFLECPNPLLERILDQEQHNWYITNAGGKLLIAPKRDNNVTTREDRFYFRMMSDHFVVRHNWEKFVTRLQWNNSIEFEVCNDVHRVFAEQHIDPDLEQKVQGRVGTVLRKAWTDAKKDELKRAVAASPASDVLKRAMRKVRKWQRNRKAPRISPEELQRLLACPYCRAELTRDPGRYRCVGCARVFTDSDNVAVLL